jgi:cytosine/creatinine deaminase
MTSPATVPGASLVITGARPWGGDLADIVIDDGVISAILPPGQAPAGAHVIDGAGQVAVPSFSDVHVHLDSTRLGLPFRPNTAGPGRWGCIMNDRANWRSAEQPVASRATHTLGAMIARGATTVRSHAQVDADSGLEKFEGVLAARQAHAGRADVQVVAFPQVGIHLEKGVVALLDEALRLGADLVGGIDPCEIDRDPVAHVDTVFALAAKHGKGIDLHLHEGGSLGLFSMDLVAERVEATGMQGLVTISHAFCLAEDCSAVREMIERLAGLDIALTTIAPGGRLDLPVRHLVDAGVRLGLGMDGQRDYWSPYGNADMLDRAYQLAFTQGYNRDDELDLALAVASWGGRSVIDASLPHLLSGGRPGLAPGDLGSVVLFEAESAPAAVMDRPAHRRVIHRGALVADGGELL